MRSPTWGQQKQERQAEEGARDTAAYCGPEGISQSESCAHLRQVLSPAGHTPQSACHPLLRTGVCGPRGSLQSTAQQPEHGVHEPCLYVAWQEVSVSGYAVLYCSVHAHKYLHIK
jgi:hypothetical protein